jgi:hypothetical protein
MKGVLEILGILSLIENYCCAFDLSNKAANVLKLLKQQSDF